MRTILMTVFGCAIFSSTPLPGSATALANAHETVAFSYDPIPPLVDMAGINMVVLEPDHVAQSEEALRHAKKRRQALFAYVEIGEIIATRNYFALAAQQTLRTENKNRGSWTVDQTSPLRRESIELLPDMSQFAHAVATESVYRGYYAARKQRKQYSQVTPSYGDLLAAQQANALDWYRLPTIAINYQCPAIFLDDVSSRKLQSNA